ncbi:hypothetical protein Taro_013211 [Colocasia esculenta]|uniref:Uncharacterized protein n=1 Tax=Colocasia esculenta TaxID=4460 RepID=A0A843UB89_COLES|nr:hypothetical protein [Colocasia esculenta]
MFPCRVSLHEYKHLKTRLYYFPHVERDSIRAILGGLAMLLKLVVGLTLACSSRLTTKLPLEISLGSVPGVTVDYIPPVVGSSTVVAFKGTPVGSIGSLLET